MLSTFAAGCAFPDATRFEAVPAEELRHQVVRLGIEYWKRLRGSRAFPAREDIKPREIAGALTHIVLAKVIGGGNDFEFKIVGDDVGRAYRAPLINRRMSEVAVDLPRAGKRWGDLYRQVVDTRMPVGIRGIVGHDAREVNFIESEVVGLPVGPSDAVVNYVLTFGYHALRPG